MTENEMVGWHPRLDGHEFVNSLALSFLYGPTLTSIHAYWKNYSFDYMVSMRVARGSASWLSSHGRGLGPRDAEKKD